MITKFRGLFLFDDRGFPYLSMKDSLFYNFTSNCFRIVVLPIVERRNWNINSGILLYGSAGHDEKTGCSSGGGIINIHYRQYLPVSKTIIQQVPPHSMQL